VLVSLAQSWCCSGRNACGWFVVVVVADFKRQVVPKASSCCKLTFVCLCIGCRVLVQLQGQFGLPGWGVFVVGLLACCTLLVALGAGLVAWLLCWLLGWSSTQQQSKRSKIKNKKSTLTAKTIISRKYSQHFQAFLCASRASRFQTDSTLACLTRAKRGVLALVLSTQVARALASTHESILAGHLSFD
jgi:hypothetical protein